MKNIFKKLELKLYKKTRDGWGSKFPVEFMDRTPE